MTEGTYAFALGSIRVKEKNLLNKNDLEQMLSQDNVEALLSFLSSKSMGSSSDVRDIDELISHESKKMWKYLFSLVPDTETLNLFLVENDFLNYKAVLKGTIRNYDYDSLLLSPSIIETDLLKKSVESKSFKILPDFIQSVAEESYNVLTKTKDVQLSDGIVDKGCMQMQLDLAKKTGSEIINSYFEAMAFYKNVKIALRGAKISKNLDFFKSTICPMECIDTNALIKKALNSQQSVVEYIEKINIFNSYDIMQDFKSSPSEFERQIDNYLMSIIKKSKCIDLGFEPIVAYLLARQTEFTDIRLIAFGLRTNKSPNETRGRLRTLYG